jgi:LacI family transcriptional regulator
LGKRRIGFISGPLEWLEARQRKQGWEAALKAIGEEVLDQNWVQGNWSSSSGETAFAELIQKYPQMDAVFASNDQMALGVLHYADAHGIHVPLDLSVVGFDDMAEAAYFRPSLTTIKHPLRELGILAVKTLLAQIEGDKATQIENTIMLQTDLVIRDSTSLPLSLVQGENKVCQTK